MRIRVPAPAPGGTSTTSDSAPEARPSPRQFPHGVTMQPDPPQFAQVTANCRCPFTRVLFPDPAQAGQTPSRVPGAWPVALQAVQGRMRVTLMSALTPVTDSAKLTETGYSRSWPRSGLRAL